MVDTIPDMEEILAQMKSKFLETAHEKIDRLNEILSIFSKDQNFDEELQNEFLREVHSLKGMGGTFQMPLVTKYCHHFEAFLQDYGAFDSGIIEAAQLYLDRLSDLIDSVEAADEARLSVWLEGLPQKADELVQQIMSDNLVMLVAKDDQFYEAVSSTFEPVGYKVLKAKSPFEGIEMAFVNKPQIIIAQQFFDLMSGAEFVRALDATQTFYKAKFALICPDRRKALEENLKGVQLLSEKNIENDVMNFLAIAVTA